MTAGSGSTPSGTISGNFVHASLVTDCEDQTIGTETEGTNNTWSDNIGTTNSPSGLCGVASSTTTGTPSVTNGLTFGGTLTDSAAVAGIAAGPAPTGNVVFTACGPTTAASCSNYGTSVGSSPLTPSAGDRSTAVSPTFRPTGAGTWCIDADYTHGDANYLPSADTRATNCFTVLRAAPSVPFIDDLPSIGYYGAPSVSLTVLTTGDGIQSITSSTPNVCHVAVYVAAFTGTGTCTLTASVARGSNYTAASGSPQSFPVVRAPTATVAKLTMATLVLGHTDTDSAKVRDIASIVPPNGTISFYVCGPTSKPVSCTSTSHRVGKPITVRAGFITTSTATSGAFKPTSDRYWCFASRYAGTADFVASADVATSGQCVKVTGR